MKNLVVATDHNPLIGVFKKPLGEIDNPRLLNLVQKTLWYQFRVVHVPGKENSGPDFISRHTRHGLEAPQLVGEALSVMKGRKSCLQGRELSPVGAATRGEWKERA